MVTVTVVPLSDVEASLLGLPGQLQRSALGADLDGNRDHGERLHPA